MDALKRTYRRMWLDEAAGKAGIACLRLFDAAATEEEWYSRGYLDFFGHILQRDVLQALGGPLHEKTAMEIGPGMGRLTIPAARVFGRVVGVDPGVDMQKSNGFMITKGITNAQLYCSYDYVVDDSVDFVYSYLSFTHMWDEEDVIEAVNAIATKCRPGAVVCLMFGYRHGEEPELTADCTDSAARRIIGARLTMTRSYMRRLLEDRGIAFTDCRLEPKYPWGTEAAQTGSQAVVRGIVTAEKHTSRVSPAAPPMTVGAPAVEEAEEEDLRAEQIAVDAYEQDAQVEAASKPQVEKAEAPNLPGPFEIPKKTRSNMFQAQNFFKNRERWTKIWPEFAERAAQTERELSALGPNAPFSKTIHPRRSLLNWWVDNLHRAPDIAAALSYPNEELVEMGRGHRDKNALVEEIRKRLSGGKPTVNVPIREAPVLIPGAPVFRMVANAHANGGGEMSSALLMEMMRERGYRVIFHPTARLTRSYPLPPDIEVGPAISEGISGTAKSDIVMWYTNDFVYKLSKHRDSVERLLDGTRRSVTCVNFVMGESWQPWFSTRQAVVLFLCTPKMEQFAQRMADKNINSPELVVHAPPVRLGDFLEHKPDYSQLHLIRHSRRGKYPPDTMALVEKFLEIGKVGGRSDMKLFFMDTPPDVRKKFEDDERFFMYSFSQMPVSAFLTKGTLYHYHLAPGLHDQGPRVIVEAMASGIPVMADNRDGAADRVIPSTGWLCEGIDDYADALREVIGNPGLLREKGEAAKQRAREVFVAEDWCRYLIG